MGAGLAAYGQLYSHQSQREKEAELLFRGNEYRRAIESYFRKDGTYPRALADLLADKRYPNTVRHIRRLYADPITGKTEWGLMEAPEGGGIMGVHSLSEDQPIKSGQFARADESFKDAKTYRDWRFFHSPSGATPTR